MIWLSSVNKVRRACVSHDSIWWYVPFAFAFVFSWQCSCFIIRSFLLFICASNVLCEMSICVRMLNHFSFGKNSEYCKDAYTRTGETNENLSPFELMTKNEKSTKLVLLLHCSLCGRFTDYCSSEAIVRIIYKRAEMTEHRWRSNYFRIGCACDDDKCDDRQKSFFSFLFCHSFRASVPS